MSEIAPTYPKPLKRGDTIQVIAPSYSLGIISDEVRAIADERLRDELGLSTTYSERSQQLDMFNSTSIDARVADLHEAFLNPEVNGIFTAIGGYSSNQLLGKLDWDLIREHPKTFCGFSDVTVLGNAILKKAGLVTYSGPHYSSFGQRIFDPYTLDSLRTALFTRGAYDITPSQEWTDDTWFLNQDERNPIQNDGHWAIQPGETEGTIIGGNLCSVNLLQGTPFFPGQDNAVAFVEDTKDSIAGNFDRDLQSLLSAQAVTGLVVGRFQRDSEIERGELEAIVASKAELNDKPVVANVNFGHTMPITTFPIGGIVSLKVDDDEARIQVMNGQE